MSMSNFEVSNSSHHTVSSPGSYLCFCHPVTDKSLWKTMITYSSQSLSCTSPWWGWTAK